MFRYNGDSNTTNNIMSHSIRRSPEAPFSQFALDSSASAAEQCLRDDRYFNLLYVNYNNSRHESNSRVHHVGENARFSTGSNSLDLDWLRSDSEKTWTNSLLDYRHMDAELAHIQQECEQMEMNIASIGTDSENNKATKALSNCSNNAFNLVGSPLTATAHPQSQPAVPTSSINLTLNASRQLIPAVNASLHRRHVGTLAEIAYNLPPLPEISGSNVADDSKIASPLMPASPIELVLPKAKTMEQQFVKAKDSNIAGVLHVEPYKCPVCLKCVRQRKPASTICGHVFCSTCIKTALRATCKCPVCQRLMTTRQIFRIYI